MPWITIRDEARAIAFLLERADAEGPFNVSSPEPIRNKQFTELLAKNLHRPAFFTVPTFALETMFGTEATHEAFLVSQRMIPDRLLQAGFTFEEASFQSALPSIS